MIRKIVTVLLMIPALPICLMGQFKTVSGSIYYQAIAPIGSYPGDGFIDGEELVAVTQGRYAELEPYNHPDYSPQTYEGLAGGMVNLGYAFNDSSAVRLEFGLGLNVRNFLNFYGISGGTPDTLSETVYTNDAGQELTVYELHNTRLSLNGRRIGLTANGGLLISTGEQRKFSVTSGLGLMFTMDLKSTLQSRHTESIIQSVKGSHLDSTDNYNANSNNYYRYSSGFSRNISDYEYTDFKLKSGYSVFIYVPLRLNYRLSKKHFPLDRIDIQLNAKIGYELDYMPDFGGKGHTMYGGHLGIVYRL